MTKPDFEVRFAWVGIASVIVFGALLAAGLFLYVVNPAGSAGRVILEAGLVMLMVAPGIRLTIAVAERVRRRDWVFVVLTLVVVVELALVMWRAANKS